MAFRCSYFFPFYISPYFTRRNPRDIYKRKEELKKKQIPYCTRTHAIISPYCNWFSNIRNISIPSLKLNVYSSFSALILSIFKKVRKYCKIHSYPDYQRSSSYLSFIIIKKTKIHKNTIHIMNLLLSYHLNLKSNKHVSRQLNRKQNIFTFDINISNENHIWNKWETYK